MKIIVTVLLALFTFSSAISQDLIDVVETTFKVGMMGEEEFYYGFAEGDILVFNFEEKDGKELKEIEIIELPTATKFTDFKSSSIIDKRIKIQNTGVYKFRFNNGSVKPRICTLKLQRIPANEGTKNFNTNWEWKTIYDTTYVPYQEDSIVGYDTEYIPYSVKELVRIDTSYVDKAKNERIHTYLNSDGDRSVVTFDLPQNVTTGYSTKEVVAWAYWFGTGEPPNVSGQLSTASSLVGKINPVAGLALGILSLTQTTAGKNLNYFILDSQQSARLFLSKLDGAKQYDSGDGSSASDRNTTRLQGRIYIGFDNDHTYPVDVDVRLSAVVVTKTYEDKQYTKEKITERKVTLNKKRMVINSSKVRVNSN